jgi:hypothetical protein
MIREHDSVVLTKDLPEEGLKAADIGTVVHIHGNGEGYEVEFMTLAGEPIAVASLLSKQVRPVTRQDIAQKGLKSEIRSRVGKIFATWLYRFIFYDLFLPL